MNNKHAARLRGMAEIENSGELMFAAVGDEDAAAYSRFAKAAMLAGAEALEAVEVAKAALVELKKEYEGAGMADEKRKVTYKWSLTRINAALARLEGK